MNRRERRAAPRQSPAAPLFGSALELHKAGRLQEAEPLYRRALAADPRHADTLNFLGLLALQSGRAEEAVQSIGKALALSPQNPAYHYNIAGAFRALRRSGDAVRHYRRALQLQPDHFGAQNNLGRVLHETGRLPEAEAAYRAALGRGTDPLVLCNLANVLLDQDILPEAASCFERALSQAPDLVEALNGLGSVLLGQGKAEQAAPLLRRAVALRPDFAAAHGNLAHALFSLGDATAALFSVCRSLALEDTAAARSLFAACVGAAPLPAQAGDLGELLRRAITEGWERPGKLMRPAAQLLAARPPIADAIVRAERGETGVFGADVLQDVAADGLLMAALQSAPVPRAGLERFLTAARAVLLDTAECRADVPGNGLAFWCALAGQCFINEYVFDCSQAEQDRAQTLYDRLAAALAADSPIPPIWPVAVAAYLRLSELALASRLLQGNWPEPVTRLLDTQVREPLEEQRIRATIPRLTQVSDAVSCAVQRQYEDNPYPRWVATASPGRPVPLEAHLAALFPHAGVRVPGRAGGHDILVAGCGTGQQPIEIARQFSGARLLAVDLSLASLAYAQRQTTSLGINNIEYGQADLLTLSQTGRSFDMIQASGVLHHMADPMQGWRALLALLRPGGVMFIGLYSALARRDVVSARAFIAEQGFPPTPDGMRQCRRAMADAGEGTPLRRLAQSSDFFSMSGCRDLLFHVQEHRLTLPGIQAFLSAHGLRFLGFDLAAPTAQAYRRHAPDEPAMADLGRWHAFEAGHPDTFAGMYQFWVQKA